MATKTPVFSEREVANIQATRKVCGNCRGNGKVIAEIPTRFAIKNYSCGYATFHIPCSFCHGTGAIEPKADGKMAASGGNAR
jgi:RecJ-like exonuclease